MRCISGYVRRPFTADNGRGIIRRIVSEQPMGDHFPHTAGPAACEIDSDTVYNTGLNGTSHAPGAATEEKIY
jgi:hypothetical protein